MPLKELSGLNINMMKKPIKTPAAIANIDEAMATRVCF
jgi:hypothetical protein